MLYIESSHILYSSRYGDADADVFIYLFEDCALKIKNILGHILDYWTGKEDIWNIDNRSLLMSKINYAMSNSFNALQNQKASFAISF